MPAIDAAEIEKRTKAIKKKLGQIRKLKEQGGALDPDAQAKVASEASLVAELAALESGEAPPEPAREAVRAPPPAVTTSSAAPAAVGGTGWEEEGELAADQVEKRLRTVKKKLQQIDKLKAKGGALDDDAKEKVASEAGLLREVALLEKGQDPSLVLRPSSSPAAAKTSASPSAPSAADLAKEAARQAALEPPPGDLGLLLDSEAEKRFKSLQKTLREASKLKEKDNLDKLQVKKLEKMTEEEPGVMEEIAAIRVKADEVIAERKATDRDRSARKAKSSAEAHAPQRRKPEGVDWMCPECGATGTIADLGEDLSTCIKCGCRNVKHYAPEADEEVEGQEVSEKSKVHVHKSQDLKTSRQKKDAAGAGGAPKASAAASVSAGSASWPEVREVLESGDNGVDKSRQKTGILVNQPKPGPPYEVFDTTLLKCSFLTRIELKLPPGVLAQDAFFVNFPGKLAASLLEVILKGNQLAAIPPGFEDLQRLRSFDLSHNAIQELPDKGAWENLAGSLELLDLSFNQLTSISQLTPLRKLSALKVDGNKLTSLEGISWADVKQLSMLTGVGNAITEIPEAITSCAGSMETIDLSENKITVLPAGICELKKLKSFSVQGNPIKDPKAAKNADKSLKDLKAYLGKSGKR